MFLFCLSFLWCEKAFKFNKVPFAYFLFLFLLLWETDPEDTLQFMSKSVLPMFSSGSFIVPGLTFRCLTHFEFIFLYGVRECSSFILLDIAVQFSQHHLLKSLSFLHCIFFPPLSKIN